MKEIFVYRHVPFEDLGRIEPVLRSAGLPLSYVDLFDGPKRFPTIDSAAAVVLMGGPMSANDDLAWLISELKLVAEACRRQLPVLGICLGAQLVARALGARVYRNPVKEIGWFPIFFTEAAASDPLFYGLQGPETVFHWHGETFDLPEGAVWLARSEACPHQAFRWGRAVYGLQFHLEVTPEMIADWVRQELNRGDVSGLEKLPDPNAHSARMQALAELVFRRWVGLLHAGH